MTDNLKTVRHDLEIATDFRAAANYLRIYGKTQGHDGFGYDGGPRCVIGALGSVANCDPYRVARADIDGWNARIEPYTLALGFKQTGLVYGWSDNSTAEEVIDHLESTALALEVRALRDNAQELAAERLELVEVSA